MENESRQFTLFGDNLENMKAIGQGSNVLLENDFISDFIRKYINFAIQVFNDDNVDDLDKKINIDRLMTLSDDIVDILNDYISTDSEVVMTYKSNTMEFNTTTPDKHTSRDNWNNPPLKSLRENIEIIRPISHGMELIFFLIEKLSGSVKGELILYCGCEDNIPPHYMGWNVESFSLERVNTGSTEAIKVKMEIIRPDTKGGG